MASETIRQRGGFSVGSGWLRRLRWRRVAAEIVRRARSLAGLDDRRLETAGDELRWRILAGDDPRRHLIEAYALVREAARRAHAQEHYPVQLLGGIALFEGAMAEMQTGEGKSLTALLPAFLHALAGRGAHVITVNDYLAERDAGFARPILERLGLSVGCILHPLTPAERRRQYACDVTYGTAKEMGFDFLRDRLNGEGGGEGPGGLCALAETWFPKETGFLKRAPHGAWPVGLGGVQRGHYFALVDEADSVLIDDARTPLLIALQEPLDAAARNLYRWAARNACLLESGRDFTFQARHRGAALTRAGCRRLLAMPVSPHMRQIDAESLLRQTEWALAARLGFHADRDYVIADDQVQIVDQATGRTLDGRKWQEGLHQAIEAKEGLPVTQATRTAARITVQTYFRQYAHLAGMTGTARPAAREFRRVYRRSVVSIPPHRRCRRAALPVRIFATLAAKHQAVADEAAQIRRDGRAVLIGTPSVRASEELSQVLQAREIPHQVLNCRFHAEEAELIRQAGQCGQVTVATNMAGRGTDIRVAPDVLARGGLHVMATEMHASARIDRQLIGRTGRQGEPGTFRFLLSLGDELLHALDHRRRDQLQRRAGQYASGELPRTWLRLFRRVQRQTERTHARQRAQLLQREDRRREACERAGLDPFLEAVE